jgi:hypothetical protein
MSVTVLPDDALVARVLSRRNGSLSGVTIRSGNNPMNGLISSGVGLFFFLVYPVVVFAGLALYSLYLVRPKRLRDGPMGLIPHLIVLSNLTIMSTLVVLHCVGGGTSGLLLPDWRRPWKTFNLTQLAGSSAAVDVLLAILIGNIIERRPADFPPSFAGFGCFAAMVALDLTQTIGIALFVSEWTQLVLPGLLALAEVASSAFLAQRCFTLHQSLREAVSGEAGSAVLDKVQAFNRRVVAAGVSAIHRILLSSCVLTRSLRSSFQRLGHLPPLARS